MNTTTSRSDSLRRGGATIGGLENWNKSQWKIDRVLVLVTMPSFWEWHLICGSKLLDFRLHLKFQEVAKIWGSSQLMQCDEDWQAGLCAFWPQDTQITWDMQCSWVCPNLTKQRKGFITYCHTRRLKNLQRMQSGRDALSNVKIRVVDGTNHRLFGDSCAREPHLQAHRNSSNLPRILNRSLRVWRLRYNG